MLPTMTEPDPWTDPEPWSEPEKFFWASFNRADMKLFLLTFGGTLTANVLTVLVVGVALIVAQAGTPGRVQAFTRADTWLVIGGLVAGVVGAGLIVLGLVRDRWRVVYLGAGIGVLATMAIMTYSVIAFLFFLGKADRIK